MSIFRQYDIRGIVGKTLKNDTAKKIATIFGQMLKDKKDGNSVAIGYDARLSSKDLSNAATKGLLANGLNVIDIGLVPTPVLYYSTFKLDTSGAIMITGSHNPPEYNGMKLCIGNDTIYGGAIKEIEKRMNLPAENREAGSYKKLNILDSYIKTLTDNFSETADLIKQLERPVKVVVDSGNGTAGIAAPSLFRKLGFDLTELYSNPDGNFPNHHPDPTIEANLEELKRKVKETKSDFGIAYDGDADRIGAVDETGRTIWGDKLLLIFALDIIASWKEKEAPVIISEVKSSNILYEAVKNAGGNIIMWKTGHSLIKAKMKETGAVLAGEMSGHLFFKDRYYGYDDAIYASLRLAEIFVKNRIRNREFKLSDLLKDLPETVTTPEIRTECPDKIKHKIPLLVREAIEKENYEDIKDIITIDGVRIVFEDGWALVRASNTQSVLVSRFEAGSPENLKKIKTRVDAIVDKCIKSLS